MTTRCWCCWPGNPATPTVAAQVDATVKLVQAGVLPADSDVTLEMAGFTEAHPRPDGTVLFPHTQIAPAFDPICMQPLRSMCCWWN